MPWLQFDCIANAGEAERLGELLEQAGASSVSFGPTAGEAIFDPAPEDARLWETTTVSALFGIDTEPIQVLGRLSWLLGPELWSRFQWRHVEDQDWARAWMEHFVPLCAGERLWICPSWRTPPDPRGLNIVLDPGMAFGTGDHPSTRLCLEWLARNDRLAGARVIDYGCGSGILALAAARLGAECVWAVDLDELALEITRANALRNGLSDRIHPVRPAALDSGPVDILVANILAAPLIELAPSFTSLLPRGGQLALSGLLAEHAQAAWEAYRLWFTLDPPECSGEWILIHGTRSGSALR